jgi:hypothetical protein
MTTNTGKVLSVNVGTVREFEYGGRPAKSAIWKSPAAGRNGILALLLFSQSLAIHRHEEVIQRLSQRGMCKDAVANNGIR